MDTYSYQGFKLKYFEREKQYIQDYAASIIERVLHCFNNRFGKLDGSSDNVAAEVKEGDNIFFHICRLLNSQVLPTEVSEDSLCLQIEALTYLYEHFKNIPLLEGSNLTEVIDGYIDIVSYINTYFPVHSMDRKELWKSVFRLNQEGNKGHWRATLLILEICLCAPHTNAGLERFFSLLKYVKSTLRCCLSSDMLNALMRIKIAGPSLEEFHKNECKRCVEYWYSTKNRRTNQKKRRKIQKESKAVSKNIIDSSAESTDEDEEIS